MLLSLRGTRAAEDFLCADTMETLYFWQIGIDALPALTLRGRTLRSIAFLPMKLRPQGKAGSLISVPANAFFQLMLIYFYIKYLQIEKVKESTKKE